MSDTVKVRVCVTSQLDPKFRIVRVVDSGLTHEEWCNKTIDEQNIDMDAMAEGVVWDNLSVSAFPVSN